MSPFSLVMRGIAVSACTVWTAMAPSDETAHGAKAEIAVPACAASQQPSRAEASSPQASASSPAPVEQACPLGADSSARAASADNKVAGGHPACGPGAGDCFTFHLTPGCDNESCCNKVCDQDPDCCAAYWYWDNTCVGEANDLCGCAGEGNCFEANGTPSCDDDGCCTAVCAEDAYCCDTEWDCQCAEAAGRLCGHDACPGDGACFEANGTPGCENEMCCNTVCLEDPDCCDYGWDGLCADSAQQLCASGAGDGNCMTANGTPGCSNQECARQVCETPSESPWCCESAWDSSCAAVAAERCAQPNCPAEGDCFTAHGTPGCRNAFCCNSVCLEDPDCCLFGWDSLCAARAAETCALCPGDGPCDLPNATAGCENGECCSAVCAAYPLCCEVEWDAVCASAARALCGNPACPGEGDCLENNGSPGCSDAECCNIVCLQDWECCAFSWDTLCAQRAAGVCGIRNDGPDEAIPVSCGEVHQGTTIGAGADAEGALCGITDTSPGVWYRFMGTGTDIAVDTCGAATDFDTELSVYTGECPRALTCVAADGDACAPQSSVTWQSDLGKQYLILVGGAGVESGNFELHVCCTRASGTNFDGDEDTDLADLAVFMNCFTGLARDSDGTVCASADVDKDGRVDWEDFTELLCALNTN